MFALPPDMRLSILYILMRTDLASMNPGKAVAQGAHAASKCLLEVWGRFYPEMDFGYSPRHELDDGEELALSQLKTLFGKWHNGRGFGTKITLAVKDVNALNSVLDVCEIFSEADMPIHYGTVLDPTYPIRDGEVTHVLPILTCGYVLGYKEDLAPILGRLPLYP